MWNSARRMYNNYAPHHLILVAPWHKQLDACLSPLGSRVHIAQSLHVSCVVHEIESREVFLGISPIFPSTNFIPPFLHTHLIHFVSFHQPLWWCHRCGRLAPLLLTGLQYWFNCDDIAAYRSQEHPIDSVRRAPYTINLPLNIGTSSI